MHGATVTSPIYKYPRISSLLETVKGISYIYLRTCLLRCLPGLAWPGDDDVVRWSWTAAGWLGRKVVDGSIVISHGEEEGGGVVEYIVSWYRVRPTKKLSMVRVLWPPRVVVVV